LRSFLYKLLNWFVGFALWNALWVIAAMTVDLVWPELGLMRVNWVYFTLPSWALLRLVFPFYAIGFLKKVKQALDEAVELNADKRSASPEKEREVEIEIEGDGIELEKQQPQT
jgi:hypothetical protein